jgi:hypothetical protein
MVFGSRNVSLFCRVSARDDMGMTSKRSNDGSNFQAGPRGCGVVAGRLWTLMAPHDIVISTNMAKKKADPDPLNELVEGLRNAEALLGAPNPTFDISVLSEHLDAARFKVRQGSDPAVQTHHFLKGTKGWPSALQFQQATENANSALDALQKRDLPAAQCFVSAMIHDLGR